VNGPTGVVLLESSLTPGIHNITITEGQLGVVPPGGGLDITYTNNLRAWVGLAKDLPTSLNDVDINTLYIVQDSAANIIGINGYASLRTGVISTLASTGHLAYSSKDPMNWAQIHQLQQTEDNVPIANATEILIIDSAYIMDRVMNSLGAGQTVGVSDSYTKLTSQFFSSAAQAVSRGENTYDLYNTLLNGAFNENQISLVDSLSTLTDTNKLNNLASSYYGSGQLSNVIAQDTVASFSYVTSGSIVSDLTNFAKNNANGNLTIDITDTAANIYNALVGSGNPAFEAQVESAFPASDVTQYSQIRIKDTVANIKAAYDSGKIATIEAAAKSFLVNTSLNLGLSLYVEDTVTNIDAFLNNSTYSPLSSKTSSYIVVDNVSNILASLDWGDWNSGVVTSNNIVVKDTFANIKANETELFSDYYNNNMKPSKIVFTDINGANANNPLFISPNYSENGLMPLLDFTQVSGFQGNVTVTESSLNSAPIGYDGPIGHDGNFHGSSLKIIDTAGRHIEINIISYRTGANDPGFSNLNNILLAENISRINIYEFNEIDDSNYYSPDEIYGFLSGLDKIDLRGIDADDSMEGHQQFTFTEMTPNNNSVWYENSGDGITVFANNLNYSTDLAIKLPGIYSINVNDLIL
jgi:hypothetical protein